MGSCLIKSETRNTVVQANERDEKTKIEDKTKEDKEKQNEILRVQSLKILEENIPFNDFKCFFNILASFEIHPTTMAAVAIHFYENFCISDEKMVDSFLNYCENIKSDSKEYLFREFGLGICLYKKKEYVKALEMLNTYSKRFNGLLANQYVYIINYTTSKTDQEKDNALFDLEKICFSDDKFCLAALKFFGFHSRSYLNSYKSLGWYINDVNDFYNKFYSILNIYDQQYSLSRLEVCSEIIKTSLKSSQIKHLAVGWIDCTHNEWKKLIVSEKFHLKKIYRDLRFSFIQEYLLIYESRPEEKLQTAIKYTIELLTESDVELCSFLEHQYNSNTDYHFKYFQRYYQSITKTILDQFLKLNQRTIQGGFLERILGAISSHDKLFFSQLMLRLLDLSVELNKKMEMIETDMRFFPGGKIFTECQQEYFESAAGLVSSSGNIVDQKTS